MKFYSVFSRECGESEFAFLVVAENIKQAKRIGWQCFGVEIGEFIDLGIRWIRDIQNVLPLVNKEKLDNNIPYAIDNIIYCQNCGLWGAGITNDKKCQWCDEYPGEELIRAFENFNSKNTR